MRKEDLQDILRRFSPVDMTAAVLTMRSGASLTVESVARFEPQYMVLRGREGGTTDDGRGFFIPYDEVCFVKLDKLVKGAELKRMYGETVALDFEERMAAEEGAAAAAVSAATTPAPVASAGTDPASIAKQNLLARIRAARTAGGGTPPAK